MKSFIFICAGNTCRSPMAEGIFKNMLKEKNIEASVSSFGLNAFGGEPPSKFAVAALTKYGIDISNHISRPFDLSIADSANSDTVFVAMNLHMATVLSSLGLEKKSIRVLDVNDPFGGSFEVYQKCADELYTKLKALLFEFYQK